MNHKGYALPLVLIVLALLFTVAAALLGQIRNQLDANQNYRNYEICILVVENAFAEAEAELNADFDYRGTGVLKSEDNGGRYSIEVVPVSGQERSVRVTAEVKNYKKVFQGTGRMDENTRKISGMSYYMEK
ncbi:MAG: hypothetical protein EUB_03015 [Eubacterium sp.]|uniref:hypothetical protein n=1 Tax=Eubacterium sp. TaxID=142586 RepID=UPI003039F909|nr:hypothetical protein [Eubacterium limosum]